MLHRSHLLALLLLTPAVAYAAETEPATPVKARAHPAPDDIQTGAVIEVTATQQERTIDESPAPVLVLQRRELERAGSLDLSQALAFAPGVTVSITENSARGGGPGVSIQGVDGKHVLVLLNGRPFLGDADGAVDVSAIPVSILERIEIVSGPMAVLYGSGAIGGVINLITRDAGAGSGGPHLSTNARYATYNTADFSQALAYGASKMSALAVGSYSSSDGFDLEPTFPDTDGEAYRRSSGFLSLSWRPKPGLDIRLDTLYGTDDRLRVYRDTQYESTLGKDYYHNWKWDESRLFSNLSLDWRHDTLQLTGSVSASTYTRYYVDEIQGAESARNRDTDVREVSGRLVATWMPLPSLMVLGGLEGSDQYLNSVAREYDSEGVLQPATAEVAGKRLTQLEAFALVDKTFFHDHLELYGGLRLNYTNLFGFYPPSMINVRWRALPPLNLRANVALGYRTPNLKELYYNFDHSDFGYIIIGNPDLKPEYSLNTQLSAELDLTDRGMIRIGYFYNDIINLIDFVQQTGTNDSGDLVFQTANIKAALTQGAEALASYRLGLFNLGVSYQYLDARDKSNGLPLLYKTDQTGKLNVTWKVWESGIELTSVARYNGRQWVTDDADSDTATYCPDLYSSELAGPGWNTAGIATVEAACYKRSSPFVVLDARFQARFQMPDHARTLVFYAGMNDITNVVRVPTPLTTANANSSQTLDVRPQPGRVFFIGLRGEM